MDHPQTRLRQLRRNFEIAAKAFASAPQAVQRLYFIELSFDTDPMLFARMGVSGVPFIYHLPKVRGSGLGLGFRIRVSPM